MITIETAAIADLNVVRKIAYKTWPDTYGKIVSAAQIDYMLESLYSIETLSANVTEKGHYFLLVKEEDNYLGFASYEHNYNAGPVTKIHKIYILPEAQGKGVGKMLIHKVADLAKEAGIERLCLNVNRHNKARFFYEKLGFTIVAEELVPLNHGYVMDDYIMEKQI
ncbi:MAG TPA: GNAT family N-acetyltransferase [Flavobacterium sp.]|jgi:GNAT superfamily N-acetyltransferase